VEPFDAALSVVATNHLVKRRAVAHAVDVLSTVAHALPVHVLTHGGWRVGGHALGHTSTRTASTTTALRCTSTGVGVSTSLVVIYDRRLGPAPRAWPSLLQGIIRIDHVPIVRLAGGRALANGGLLSYLRRWRCNARFPHCVHESAKYIILIHIQESVEMPAEGSIKH
jgi:hypothetical protein